MSSIDNYRYLLFKYLYNYLRLNEVENRINNSIKPLSITSTEGYDIISKYFFLKNDVDINRFTKEEFEIFDFYFKKNIYECDEKELKIMEDFVQNTYKKLIFPDVSDKYVYYGPINDNYLCPKDSIVIGIYYDSSNENDFEIDNQVIDIANYIQFEIAKKVGLTISVVIFNQFTLDNVNSFNK